MPVEITAGPPLLSINQGATFMVTDLGGEIQADTEQGVFADDTRFVSYYAISANGVPWQRLNSAATAYFAARSIKQRTRREKFHASRLHWHPSAWLAASAPAGNRRSDSICALQSRTTA